MSLRDDRQRRRDEQQQRALVAMQDAVLAAVGAKFPAHGPDSTVVGEGVAEALCQLVLAGEYHGSLDQARKRWILYAERRVIDALRRAEEKRRESDPVEDHEKVLTKLAVSASGELAGISEADWRLHEVFSRFHGDARRWLEAWVDRVIDDHPQPQGLDQELGLSQKRTEWISRDTRAKILAFTERRASGAVCQERQALLDPFILATAGRPVSRAGLDDERFLQVLVHIAGCEDCRAAWHSRRRQLLGRCLGILTLPFGHAAAAAAALRAKLTGLFGTAHSASHSVRQRLGFGGGGAVVTGSGAATISGKAAALCGAAVCAAGAGGAAVVTGGSALIPAALLPTHHAAHHPKPSAAPVAHLTSYTPPPTTNPAPVTTPAPAAQPPPAATQTVAQKPTGTVAQQPSAPGDLPPASSTSATATSSPPATLSSPSSSAAPTHSTPTPPPTSSQACAPGDLGC